MNKLRIAAEKAPRRDSFSIAVDHPFEIGGGSGVPWIERHMGESRQHDAYSRPEERGAEDAPAQLRQKSALRDETRFLHADIGHVPQEARYGNRPDPPPSETKRDSFAAERRREKMPQFVDDGASDDRRKNGEPPVKRHTYLPPLRMRRFDSSFFRPPRRALSFR